MLQKTIKRMLLVTVLLVVSLTACGCGQQAQKTLEGTAPNDILTFVSNADNKPIIRIATQYHMPDNSLIETLQAKYPDYLFVLDYSAAAGIKSQYTIHDQLMADSTYDLLISSDLSSFINEKSQCLSDLSAEGFISKYLLSALNSISIGGHIYSIPGTSTLYGIAYNTELFAKHGWEIPKTTDEFFALCSIIRQAGITPFSTCFKYSGQVSRVLGCMCYAQVYMSPEDIAWLADVEKGQATFRGHYEPVLELAKRFYNEGVITIDDFTASLTKQRQAFWAGEYAMIDYDSSIFTYAESEGAPFEVGIMPYPAKNAEDSGFAIKPEYYLGIPKLVEQDAERLAFVKEILDFLSTAEGQKAMLSNSLRISNVKDVDLSDNPAFAYAREAYERGNLYPIIHHNYQQDAVKTIFEGGSVDDALTIIDDGLKANLSTTPAPVEHRKLATAESDFTMLETSYYLADKLRQATGADVALMIDRSFFRSNLSTIKKGDVATPLDGFALKGIGAEDYLTTYALTGSQLRQLMEHPIVNGQEIDALIAASGLALEYAPWNERGSRVIKLTLESGAAIEDEKLYTVAAFAGVIDAQYITETVAVHSELGALADILEPALEKDGTIKPDTERRLKLIWPEGK